MSPRNNEWRCELQPTIEAVEDFCTEFRRWRASHCPQLDGFSTELILREALANSVTHGLGQDPRRSISCILRANRFRLLIAIVDGGHGFDWRAHIRRKSAVSGTNGRGVEILRQYASRVRFNAKGNAVALVKRF